MRTRTKNTLPRRSLLVLASVLCAALVACTEAEPNQGAAMAKQETVSFDVVVFSYVNRPIFDVLANGRLVAGALSAHGGGQSLMTGVTFPIGPQTVTWRLDGPEGMVGNGDTVAAVNQPVLAHPKPEQSYLGIHIYPDGVVEFVPSDGWPDATERGEAISRAAGAANGK